jgi:hypothetical protein
LRPLTTNSYSAEIQALVEKTLTMHSPVLLGTVRSKQDPQGQVLLGIALLSVASFWAENDETSAEERELHIEPPE